MLQTAVGCIAVASVMSGCNRDVRQNRELFRATAPRDPVDIVVTEVPTDATVSRTFEIFIVPRGERVTGTALVFRSDKSPPPQVQWAASATAVIKCNDARVWHFQNFSSIRLGSNRWVTTAIALECGQAGYVVR
ncbi:MAG TPA: hypothetical protein VIR81_08610 [Myxococcales bacterium]